MKTLIKPTTVLLLALSANAQAAGKLSLYNWFEYMPKELLDKFSEQYDVEVTMDTFDSNEAMLASLKAGKLGSYDLSVPGDYMVKIMANDGMLDTFEPSELSNFGNISKQWVDVSFDPGRHSSIPYQWGSTSYSVNRDLYKGPIDSLSVIFNPPEELKGKINVLDTAGETLTLASLYLGIPQCSTDREQLKSLSNLVNTAKKDWASFGSDVAKDVLVSGDAAAGMIWSGFSAKGRAEGANLEYSFPKEGYIVWMDNIVLLKDAPNRDNAIKFMNFMLEPENVAMLSNYTQYPSGVDGVEPYLIAEVKDAPEANPPANAKGIFVETCSQPVQEMYDAIWTRLKK